MICPEDGSRLGCTNTRTRDGYVSRNYKCPKCGGKFVTAEFFRERQTQGRQSREVRGEAFGDVQIRSLKAKFVEQLHGLIDQVEAS